MILEEVPKKSDNGWLEENLIKSLNNDDYLLYQNI